MSVISYNISNIRHLLFNFMRHLLTGKVICNVIIVIIVLLSHAELNAQNIPDTRSIQTGHRLYNSKEYDKAAPIFKGYYEETNSYIYFELYINCLTELRNYKNAEKEINKEIKIRKLPEYYVLLGYLYKQQGEYSKSGESYNRAINMLHPVKQEVINLANAFKNKREFDLAIATYEKGKKILPDEFFHMELAMVHYLVRNYSKMLDEYLQMLKREPGNLATVQSRLASAFYYDIDGVLKKEVKEKVLAYIHEYPNDIVYSKLIIWYFTHNKQFGKALVHTIALDKRTNSETQNIYNLAGLAASNKAYYEAEKACDYLINKKGDTQLLKPSVLRKVHIIYSRFVDEYPNSSIETEFLEKSMKSVFDNYGINAGTLEAITDYAEFLAFYARRPTEAGRLVESSLKMPGITKNNIIELKYLLARCCICSGDLWGATLLCTQISDMAGDNPLADDADLLKAKAGYFMGNYSWALAQLDIIKAATSKLIANDAMELSLFIKNFTPPDSTDLTLDKFARAERKQFCNRPDEALEILDSIIISNPGHPLLEEVIYKKAHLYISLKQYNEAALLFEEIIDNYSWGRRIEDALFELAQLYSNELNNQDRAMELYKTLILNHKSSIYLEKARNEFRRLREEM